MTKATVSKQLRIQMSNLNINGKNYPLYLGQNTIGRNKSATVTLKNEIVSQQQAIITIIDGDKHFVSDLQSCNGTFLNSQKLQPFQLYEVSEDSIILFGNVSAVYNKIQDDSTKSVNKKNELSDTQIVNESFYTRETQSIDATDQKQPNQDKDNNKQLSVYFQDDFDSSCVPSTPISSTSINDIPTQLLSNPISKDNEMETTGHKLRINDLVTQTIREQIPNNEFKVQTDIVKKKNLLIFNTNDEDLNENEGTVTECDETAKDKQICEVVDTSADIIETSILDDSGVNTTIQSPLQNTIPFEENKITDSESQSQIHVVRFRNRNLPPITEESEEIVKKRPSKLRKLSESFEDFENESNRNNNNTPQTSDNGNNIEIKDSESETDIEDDDVKKAELKSKYQISDSETDIEDSNETSADHRKSLNYSTKKENEATTTSTDIISNQNSDFNKFVCDSAHLSDDDENEFGIIQEKNTSNNTNEIDISQKIKDLHNNIKMPEILSEESLQLDLSEVINTSESDKRLANSDVNLSFNNGREADIVKSEYLKDISVTKAYEKNATSNNDIIPQSVQSPCETPDILDFTKPVTDNDLSNEVTQRVVREDLSNVKQSTSNLETDIKQSQEIEHKNKNNPYSFGSSKDEITKRNTDEFIFMQATQKVNCPDISFQEVTNNIPNDDDFYEQPTQAVTNNQEDIFLNPTQKLHVMNKECKEDIFSEATQKLMSDTELTPKKENGHGKNGQSSTQPKSNMDENLFLVPTQTIAMEHCTTSYENSSSFKKPLKTYGRKKVDKSLSQIQEEENEELFLQPTQLITSNTPTILQECTLSTKISENKTKFEDVESQLEVMFASQTIELNAQVNSPRPLNPLANLFDEQNTEENTEIVDSSSLKEYCEMNTLPMDELIEIKTSKKENQLNIEECVVEHNTKEIKSSKVTNRKRKIRDTPPAISISEEEGTSTRFRDKKVKQKLENSNKIDDYQNVATNKRVLRNTSCVASISSNPNICQDLNSTIMNKNKKLKVVTTPDETCPGSTVVENNINETIKTTTRNKENKTKTDSANRRTKQVNSKKEPNQTLKPRTRRNQKNEKSNETSTNDKHENETPQNVDDPQSSSSSTSTTIGTRSKRKRLNITETESVKKRTRDINPITEMSTPVLKQNNKVKRKLIVENTNKPKDSSKDHVESTSNNSRIVGNPERSRRQQKPKVVFTMFDSPELESTIRSLGGMVVDSVDSCTVLVTASLKRSAKLLCAVGQGKPICAPQWLEECKKANTFLDPWNFILKDNEAEAKWKLSLRESLNRSITTKLLESYTIQLIVNDPQHILKAAIEACGGKCISKALSKCTTPNYIIVSSPENKAKYSKFLKRKNPITVVAAEAIFDGVLRQEVHWEDHLLS